MKKNKENIKTIIIGLLILFAGGRLVYGAVLSQSVSVTASGQQDNVKINLDKAVMVVFDDATPASQPNGTLDTSLNYAEIGCYDDDNCTFTMGETNAVEGQFLFIVSTSTRSLQLSDSAGVSEIGSAESTITMTASSTLMLIYTTESWVELKRDTDN